MQRGYHASEGAWEEVEEEEAEEPGNDQPTLSIRNARVSQMSAQQERYRLRTRDPPSRGARAGRREAAC